MDYLNFIITAVIVFAVGFMVFTGVMMWRDVRRLRMLQRIQQEYIVARIVGRV